MGCNGDCGCPQCSGHVADDDPAVQALAWGVQTAELNPAQSDFWKFNTAKAVYDDAIDRGVADNDLVREYVDDLDRQVATPFGDKGVIRPERLPEPPDDGPGWLTRGSWSYERFGLPGPGPGGVGGRGWPKPPPPGGGPGWLTRGSWSYERFGLPGPGPSSLGSWANVFPVTGSFFSPTSFYAGIFLRPKVPESVPFAPLIDNLVEFYAALPRLGRIGFRGRAGAGIASRGFYSPYCCPKDFSLHSEEFKTTNPKNELRHAIDQKTPLPAGVTPRAEWYDKQRVGAKQLARFDFIDDAFHNCSCDCCRVSQFVSFSAKIYELTSYEPPVGKQAKPKWTEGELRRETSSEYLYKNAAALGWKTVDHGPDCDTVLDPPSLTVWRDRGDSLPKKYWVEDIVANFTLEGRAFKNESPAALTAQFKKEVTNVQVTGRYGDADDALKTGFRKNRCVVEIGDKPGMNVSVGQVVVERTRFKWHVCALRNCNMGRGLALIPGRGITNVYEAFDQIGTVYGWVPGVCIRHKRTFVPFSHPMLVVDEGIKCEFYKRYEWNFPHHKPYWNAFR